MSRVKTIICLPKGGRKPPFIRKEENRRRTRWTLFVVAVCLVGFASASWATTDCTFTITGSKWELDADCSTDATIFVPDGITLNGKNRTITATDPPAGTFVGAVIATSGTFARVEKVRIVAVGLANSCKSGADRLRGIMFAGASGSITKNTIIDINKGASGCQEGNGIEVRNPPFNGTHPDTQIVKVSGNKIIDYQKTGIVANGDVMVKIDKNTLSESATQANLAANTIQLGFGAIGSISKNKLDGNQWFGWSPASDFAASAILVFLGEATKVDKNKVRGNSDVGLFIIGDDGKYEKNNLKDMGVDGGGYDIGVGNYGTGNVLIKNKVKGFDTPYDPPLPTGPITLALGSESVAVPRPFK